MFESRYHVTKLYGETGQVAEHFVNDEFHMYCDTWEHAMPNPHFAAIIERELQAEQVADLPLGHLCELAPNDRVRSLFLSWLDFIDNDLDPWTTGGAIHFRPHWARVLMHALVIGDAMELPDIDLKCLAMAAVFHDSRRSSPYLDAGHGARAAGYYAQECRRFADAVSPNERLLEYDPRALLVMAWHDRPDDEGVSALERFVAEDRIGVPAADGGGAGARLKAPSTAMLKA